MSKLILWCVIFFVLATKTYANSDIKFLREAELERINDILSTIQQSSNAAAVISYQVESHLHREVSKFRIQVNRLKKQLDDQITEYHDIPNGVNMTYCKILSEGVADTGKSFIGRINVCIADNLNNIFVLEMVVKYFTQAEIRVTQIKKEMESCDVDPKNITELEAAKECYHSSAMRGKNELLKYVDDWNSKINARTLWHVRQITDSCLAVHEYSAVNKNVLMLGLKTAKCIRSTRKRTFWERVAASILGFADSLCTPTTLMGSLFCYDKSVYTR